MMYTLQDACEFVSRFVETGVCATDPICVERVNEAVRRLMRKMDPKGTMRRVRFFVKSNVLVLPRECERLTFCGEDSVKRKVLSAAYEFLPSGPGILDGNDSISGGYDLMDLQDGWPYFYEMPTGIPWTLMAFSTAIVDSSNTIDIRGWDLYGNEIRNGASLGCQIPINRWMDGAEGQIRDALSQNKYGISQFAEISRVYKTETEGYVSLYAVDLTTQRMYFLAKYHPDDTIPSFHRYRVQGADLVDGNSVVGWVKLRFLPATRNDDVLLIQNLDAIKQEVMAIKKENAEDDKAAEINTSKAMRSLDEEINNGRTTDGIMSIDHGPFAIGESEVR
jgi:hypothetical protein